MAGTQSNRYLTTRPIVLGLAKLFFLSLGQLPFAQAAPLHTTLLWSQGVEPSPESPNDASFWLKLGISFVLVIVGGAFAGLTIALMGQDEIYLQVLKDSGEGAEVQHATKVLGLLQKGKHWVLVTLLLSNTITNETLPIVLDSAIGGGLLAVLISTTAILIFGEIVPQSICVRYGLPIGAFMASPVLLLMYIMAPIAWPTAKLLDYLLGTDHGTTYKKAGLKTLVSLHRNLGEAGQRLHADEVTIISAVLDLKEKAIGSIMTPMDDVFTLSLDDVLDEPMIDDILSQGYSRIPVHHPDNEENFVGMLLVKMLITYDPEDAKPVRDFALATLPETNPDTSCLDIVNFFQEGKSHMVLVSNHPGGDHGAIGVVTLEDVIEELIGEEIIDESDVYVDVHKAVRRLAPAPRNRFPRLSATAVGPKLSNADLIDISENEALNSKDFLRSNTNEDLMNKDARRISGVSLNGALNGHPKISKKASIDEVREQFKHLGPSNLASRPKQTRYSSVKIKPGSDAGGPPSFKDSGRDSDREREQPVRRISQSASDYGGGIGEGVIPSGGRPASDGVQAVATEYGTLSSSAGHKSHDGEIHVERENLSPKERQPLLRPQMSAHASHDTIADLPDKPYSRSPIYQMRGPARSGSITENIVDANGIRKVVLETTSSSESGDEQDALSSKRISPTSSHEDQTYTRLAANGRSNGQSDNHSTTSKKKRRRRKKAQDQNGHNERDSLL